VVAVDQLPLQGRGQRAGRNAGVAATQLHRVLEMEGWRPVRKLSRAGKREGFPVVEVPVAVGGAEREVRLLEAHGQEERLVTGGEFLDQSHGCRCDRAVIVGVVGDVGRIGRRLVPDRSLDLPPAFDAVGLSLRQPGFDQSDGLWIAIPESVVGRR
jgi:hypothetical protein